MVEILGREMEAAWILGVERKRRRCGLGFLSLFYNVCALWAYVEFRAYVEFHPTSLDGLEGGLIG